ncbi:DNA cytosine methyltransferase [Halomonas urumqiensis]|uniref:DNA (cytosine-5-)-methyltransferase n=1 Tax=Halomonas urumqiensis TaxID=1684789 RepID=A0A2N7UDM2_9GAMM|nr:DNA cytosine methyltransferase [Halomonas urumqiensis]PMR78517.1 DNA cytosine methyltransferase [Halomonas urumqiensis]PTB03662.1 DNA cytosine methyltransferase [Halomonas urumqiensis]
MSTTIERKIERLRAGEEPRVLDLFAGCGGISLGFQAAGFRNVGAVELDPAAARSHALNFHRDAPEELREIHAQSRDVVSTEPEDLLKEFRLGGDPESHVDVVVGGPPCQSFARVGRAKLREVAEHPEAYLNDPRGNLYLRYLHYVRKLKPVAILMENVPDVLNYGGHNIAEEVCEALRDLGYDARYTMLNAVFYGVPEMRERMFLVAYRTELNATRWFPAPTHWINLPRGYHGSRQVAMKTVKTDLLDGETRFFVDPPEPEKEGLKPAVTAVQALSDLPFINEDSEQKLRKGPRRFERLVHYPDGARLNDFQKKMRSWPEFEASEGIYDHVIRYLPRDYKIFARMQPGDQYPEAYQLASEMFEERLSQIEMNEGFRPLVGTDRYEAEKKAYIPPYDPSKFPNKWRKMEADQPARTLMAHLGKDSYSHIHYDSRQSRTISVREAARLQSFPDGFVFQGPMNPAFRQIGNAVPPLMAKALADKIKQQLTGKRENVTKNRAEETDAV